MCTVACGFVEVSGSKRATCNCREQSLQLGDALPGFAAKLCCDLLHHGSGRGRNIVKAEKKVAIPRTGHQRFNRNIKRSENTIRNPKKKQWSAKQKS